MEIKETIDKLRDELNKANYEYYVLSDPQLTDFEFDEKLKKLQTLEDENPEFKDINSPTIRIGSDINKNFKQENHKYSMLSLGNTYSQGDVREFYERIKRTLNEPFKIICEQKFDGVSISLTYENGILTKALTRGDGVVGDNVTDNVKTIRSIPLTLFGKPGVDFPLEFEVRGEVLMPWDVFENLNIKRKEQEENLFANPRNAASGTLKSQNSSVVSSRHLDSYLYYLLGESIPKKSHYENMQMIKKWGFKISENTKICNNLEEIFEYINYWDEARKDLPVATDGIVLKIDSIEQQELLGYTAKTPRWAIAYKFKAERALTRLNSVSFQVGRTGAITPVANLDPVHLSGTMVKRASLHNEDIINNLDLYLGDMVYVEKGGEIIPKITGVDIDSRILVGEKVKFIDKCPECGSDLIRYDGEAAYYCPNFEGCPPQIKGRLEHFISRKAMNIDSLGTETIDTLYKAGIVENLYDLYYLKLNDLINLDRLGLKSAEKLLDSIEQSKDVPFERVLFSLGIRFVGQTVAKILAKAFGNIDALINATYDELIEVGEIGDKIAQSVINYFKSEKNRAIIKKLKDIGLKFEIEKVDNATNLLENLKIVISGTFELHSRDEYKVMIENNGGKNVSSVSKNTSYILGGKNMGASKLQKAEKLDIKILSEDDFLKMIKK